MIDFEPITLSHRQSYLSCLQEAPERGCEYSFTNLFLWGRQKMAFVCGNAVVFSQYNRKSVYLFPVGSGDLKTTVDRIIEDAAQRGIPCRIVGLTKADQERLQTLYPGNFRFHTDRDSFDYVYGIHELAELKGRKYQRKRNHLNRFYQEHPDCAFVPITEENLPQVRQLVQTWYDQHLQEDPTADYQMEQAAIFKALEHMQALSAQGLLLYTEGQPVAMCLGSRLSEQTFDVHFEKALQHYEGGYAAINQAFARSLREQYPQLSFLNREDDMGLEGLRKAKLSYNPEKLLEKYWACLLEDGYDY